MTDQMTLLIDFAQDLRMTRMLSVSSTTVLFYDAILSFPSELEYIWNGPRGTGKILYLAGRYPFL
ncbi:hypothetical protein BD410DRAFT_796764 [Rickenella mellea]|uniref:DUF6533 domain-containing protein n=1 Tax=Rickenella mellea TaxID=50990 RepID=A0A4Y7PIX5_9AGAM|nr:hypothetical protein BD410DRAFT_796764 [Rickenella mellea]